MRHDVFVYLSGPITARDGFLVEENVTEALKVFLMLIDKGIPAFCPQIFGAFPSAFTIDWQKWMEYDFAVIDRCTHMLMLNRWQTSKGALEECAYAAKKSIPIFYSVTALIKHIG